MFKGPEKGRGHDTPKGQEKARDMRPPRGRRKSEGRELKMHGSGGRVRDM
jgi:hypothetical protein